MSKVSYCIPFSPSQVYRTTQNEAPKRGASPKSIKFPSVIIFLDLPENLLYPGSKNYTGEMEFKFIVFLFEDARGFKLLIPNVFISKHFPNIEFVDLRGQTEVMSQEMLDCLDAPETTRVCIRSIEFRKIKLPLNIL